MNKTLRSLQILALGALLSLSSIGFTGCGAQLGAGMTMGQSNFGGIQNQTAVPNEYLIRRKGVAFLDTPQDWATKNGILYISDIEALGVELFKVSDPAILDKIKDQVEYAEPNYLRHLSIPAQSGVQQQSVLRTQDADAGATLPASNNYIAIIDTGVDANHEDLKGKLIAGHNTLGQDGIDDDNGHGTYLAGIAVASDASQQLKGVLPNGKILPIKALDANGIGTDFSVAQGIVTAIEYGAQVIVLSATGANQSQALTAAIDYANKLNVPIVVPSGNAMDAASVFPASSRSVLSVNSVGVSGQSVTSFSKSSPTVTISAVAQGIRSTLPTHGFRLQSVGLGQGFGQLETPGAAAIQVAAAISAIKTLNPGIKLPDIRNKLLASAVALNQPGTGAGRLSIASVARNPAINSAATQQRAAQPIQQPVQQPVQQRAAYPQTAYPQTTYTQAAYPQTAYPQAQTAYPQAVYPQGTAQQPVTSYNTQRRVY